MVEQPLEPMPTPWAARPFPILPYNTPRFPSAASPTGPCPWKFIGSIKFLCHRTVHTVSKDGSLLWVFSSPKYFLTWALPYLLWFKCPSSLWLWCRLPSSDMNFPLSKPNLINPQNGTGRESNWKWWPILIFCDYSFHLFKHRAEAKNSKYSSVPSFKKREF